MLNYAHTGTRLQSSEEWVGQGAADLAASCVQDGGLGICDLKELS